MIPATPPAIVSPSPTPTIYGYESILLPWPIPTTSPTPTVTPMPSSRSERLPSCAFAQFRKPRIRHGLAGWWDNEYGYIRIFFSAAVSR